MKNSFFIIIITLLSVNLGRAQDKDSLGTFFCISIPQRSGLAAANFKHYQIKNDTLYVLYQPSLETRDNIKLLESYPIDKNELNELDSLLNQTDTFGFHTSGIFVMGWPRFIIYSKYKGKELNGYIANCYRENIFVFVDWLNKVYPKGKVIPYDKEKLIKGEKNK